jgi:hypothetical protein
VEGGLDELVELRLSEAQRARAIHVLFLRVQIQGRSAACGVVGVYLCEMPKSTFDNKVRYTLHRRGDVGEKPGLLILVEQIEQRARLGVIVVALAVVVAIRITRNLARRFGEIRAFYRTIE